jgi:hypothetical protein
MKIDGMTRWHLWAIWLLSLLAAPAGLWTVDRVYPDVPSFPPPWPAEPSAPERLANGLLFAHLGASAAAAAAVPALARGWPARLVAWAGIVVWLGMTGLLTLGTVMAKTGKYV